MEECRIKPKHLGSVFEKTNPVLISRMSLCYIQMSYNYIEEDIKR